MGIQWQACALAFVEALFQAPDLTWEQKEAIARAAMGKSPAAQRGEDQEFEIMVLLTSVKELHEASQM